MIKRPSIDIMDMDDDADSASVCSVLPASAGGRTCIYGGESSNDTDPITAAAFVSTDRSIANNRKI